MSGRAPARVRLPRPSAGVLLLVAAIALELVYAAGVAWPMRIWSRPVSPATHLVATFGVDRVGAARYVATVLVLFALYGAALWLVLRRAVRPSRRAVLAGGALFCATLVLTHPLTSTDIFNYIASARVEWVHGDNPLTVAPRAYPDDRFFALVANWRDLPSPYGPAWSLLTFVPHTLGGGRYIPTVLAYKALAAGSLLAAGWLCGLTAERLRPGWGAAAALALTWNPLAVWHVAGNGHNDAVMVFLLALAAYLLVRGLPGPAVLAFTLSALIKFATLLLVPAVLVWWWRRGRHPRPRALLPWLAGAALLAGAAYASYWQGLDTFRASLDEGSYFTVSGPAALRGALTHLMSVGRAELVTVWAARVAFAAVYGVVLWRLRGSGADDLLAAGSLALTAYLLVAAPYFAPWYVLWPLAPAVMVPWRREALYPVLALTLTAMSVLVWATWARVRFAADPVADWYPMHLLSFVSVAPLPVAAWWLARRRERGRERRSADVDAPVLERQVAGAGGEA